MTARLGAGSFLPSRDSAYSCAGPARPEIFAYAAVYQQGINVTRDTAMFYVQRDATGQLLRVEAASYEGFSEILPADNAEIQEWFGDDEVENSLKQLKQSDLDMIRVLEDLIDVLTAKGVFSITDLPAGAQAKLLNRSKARKALGSLNNLIDEEEQGGLI
jgi:hypothetical protein